MRPTHDIDQSLRTNRGGYDPATAFEERITSVLQERRRLWHLRNPITRLMNREVEDIINPWRPQRQPQMVFSSDGDAWETADDAAMVTGYKRATIINRMSDGKPGRGGVTFSRKPI